MGRKRKQVDAEGINKSNLPPCRVCDAPGAGFHYGVNTCEACKVGIFLYFHVHFVSYTEKSTKDETKY